MRFWEIEKLAKGKDVAILGNGPTLPNTVLQFRNFLISKSTYVIGVNESGFSSYADMLFFGDAKWYVQNKYAMDMSIRRLSVTYNRHPENLGAVRYSDDIKFIQPASGFGICADTNKVRFNRSSGACAINLAYHLGARRIVLFGFDMRQIEGRKNWFSRDYESDNTKNMEYHNFLVPFPFIAEDARKLKLSILNTSPDSALKSFPFINYEDDLWLS